MRDPLLVAVPVPTLLISGTVAAGKSTIAAEINDTLAALEIPNAAVDLDALVWQWPSSSEWNSDLMFENLAALWPNYQAHGVTHLVLAGVLEDAADLEHHRVAVPGAQISVCRLTAPQATRIDRLRQRMPPGARLDWHLARTGELDGILQRRAHEDFVVDNGPRQPREVAIEVLLRAGWISNQQAQDAAVAAG
jgi:predicted kinase